MIKLMDLLVENDNTLTSKDYNDIGKILSKKYQSIVRIEYDRERRGEFIRVVFDDYKEAYNFHYHGWDMLSKIVNLSSTNPSGPKSWLGGVKFVVSYKIIVD